MKAYGRTRGGAPRPAHVVLTASAQCGRNNTRERPLLRSYRMNFGVTYKSARHFIAPRGGGWLVAVLCVLVRGAEGGGPRCVLPALCAPVGPVVKLPDTDRATFSVSGLQVVIEFSEAQFVKLECPEGVTLASAGMPSFVGGARVPSVRVRGCGVGAGSLLDGLAALNVTVLDRLSLEDPPLSSLSARHLRGLQHLAGLDLDGTGAPHLQLETGALLSLVQLKVLRIINVNLSSDDVVHFPRQIEILKLINVGMTHYDLNHFSHLMHVRIHAEHAISMNARRLVELRTVILNGYETNFPPESRPSSLQELQLFSWKDSKSWSGCSNITTLQLHGVQLSELALPEGWVSRCRQLRTLKVAELSLTLPLGLLRDVTFLNLLSMRNCALRLLPEDLFRDTLNLTIVDFENNLIESLPRCFRNLFSKITSLKKLNLSNNKLKVEAVGALGTLVSLQVLSLSDNPTLMDLCPGNSNAHVGSGTSPLKALTELDELRLGHTGVSHVCSDWRTSMKQLSLLDLSYTNITSLSYLDFHYERSGSKKLTVNFNGTPVSELTVDAGNYKSVIADLASASVKIILRATLPCDCLDYWTALAFGNLSTQAQDSVELLCREEERGSLADALERESLECAESSLCEDQEGCTCSVRPDLSHGVVATASCEGAGLDEMPSRLKFKEAPAWRLMLAHNHIQTVRFQDLPDTILELDLRNNSLHRLDGPTASKLSTVPLWIANNSLDCTCHGYDLVTNLELCVLDMEQATCDDGTPLIEAQINDPTECSSFVTVTVSLISALALLAVMVAVTAGCGMRPEMRLRVKVLLLRLGWLPRRPEPDDGRRFDAFVSYAHEDEAVVEELVKRLEVGHGYRLCLHYRDWPPGEWIHVQIAASVQAARRTLIVVSRHFLRSKWARQEFRQAHAAALRDVTPRLVLLFLEPPHRLPLDAELRSYIRINTYLLWTDPWFWHKLKLALPPPRLLPTPFEDVSVNKAESSPLQVAPRPQSA
uniref:TIR domain-containing protein n=1 Tax=Bombyx mori TaxID=7091 RepID=A0A8R2QXS6_BOMMO|nr:protein toll [Bombyx mori]